MFKINIEGSGPGPIGAPPQDVEVLVNGHVIKGVQSINLVDGVEFELKTFPAARIELLLGAGVSVRKMEDPAIQQDMEKASAQAATVPGPLQPKKGQQVGQ